MSRTALHNSVRINLHSTMFIFILSRFIFCVRFGLHLHSTMFIFISEPVYCSFNVRCIYIPLCLYLYITKCICIVIYCRIYIPLCLYLYLMRPLASRLKNAHLHSTMFIFIWTIASICCI